MAAAASSWKQARPHSCLEKEGREGEGVYVWESWRWHIILSMQISCIEITRLSEEGGRLNMEIWSRWRWWSRWRRWRWWSRWGRWSRLGWLSEACEEAVGQGDVLISGGSK